MNLFLHDMIWWLITAVQAPFLLLLFASIFGAADKRDLKVGIVSFLTLAITFSAKAPLLNWVMS